MRAALNPLICLLLLLTPLTAHAQTTPAPDFNKTVISENGLVGELYTPTTPGRHPAVLVVGGSEGGLKGSAPIARRLAQQGYSALAIAYFDLPGLPDRMELLPLEYFDKALDRLEADASVDRRRVAVMGASKGGEAALIIGSRRKDVRAVIAGVPSSVMWQGFSFKTQVNSSTWSLDGQPTAFVPYDMSKPFVSVLDLYQRSLALADRNPDAFIPVEKIRGPVLLVGGEADQLWPSADMARSIAARLKAKGFRYPVTVLTYADAGHAAFGPPVPAGSPSLTSMTALGGTEAGIMTARQQSWDAALDLLAKTLK